MRSRTQNLMSRNDSVNVIESQRWSVQGVPFKRWTKPPKTKQPKSGKRMGLFTVGCKVENPADARQSVVVPKLLVDTGSEFTWIDENVLRKIGLEPRKKDIQFQMANGQIIARSMGFAVLHVARAFTVDEVVFAQKGDLLLLGSRTLEGLNLLVDPANKRLVAAGPRIAAVAIAATKRR